MRHALPLALAALILGGCSSHKPEDYNGTWINQAAIDAAAKGGSLRQALAANGPVSEVRVDVASQQASYLYNGYENVNGRLRLSNKQWQVDFDGGPSAPLQLKGKELVTVTEGGKEQAFSKALTPAAADTPVGSTFEKALYGAYLGGNWKIIEGTGKGETVQFSDTGSVTGLPGPNRYALCLGGDCATMGGANDSLWLERDQRGAPFIFKHSGDQLEIFQAINRAQPDEMPQLAPGPRQWLLERS